MDESKEMKIADVTNMTVGDSTSSKPDDIAELVEAANRLDRLNPVSKAIILAAINEAYRLCKKNNTLQPLKYDFTFTPITSSENK